MNNEPALMPEKPKGRSTTLIIIIVVLVVCCLCALVLGLLYQFGDTILRALGLA